MRSQAKLAQKAFELKFAGHTMSPQKKNIEMEKIYCSIRKANNSLIKALSEYNKLRLPLAAFVPMDIGQGKYEISEYYATSGCGSSVSLMSNRGACGLKQNLEQTGLVMAKWIHDTLEYVQAELKCALSTGSRSGSMTTLIIN